MEAAERGPCGAGLFFHSVALRCKLPQGHTGAHVAAQTRYGPLTFRFDPYELHEED
jgi:hypothetical protein